MPRAFDLNPQNLQVDHNPTVQLGMSTDQVSNFLSSLPELIEQGLETAINTWLTEIDGATGLDLVKWATLIEGWLSGDSSPSGGSDLLSRLTDLLKGVDINATQAWQNWVSFLGNLEQDTVDDLTTWLQDGVRWLRDILVPAGALTSWTTIPGHLFSHLGTSLLENLLPDGGFNISTALDGESIWVWDGTQDHTGTTGSGSALFVGSGVLGQLVGVPVQVIDGQTVQLGTYVRWSGVSGSGNAIALAVNAYDADDTLISDPTNRVVDAIASPPTNSTGASGLVDTQGVALTPDSDGWVPLVGQYITPTGTKYVRLCCEVETAVTAGNIWFDDCSLWCPVIDSTLLGNLENHPILGPDRVAGIGGLTDLETTLLGWMTKFSTAIGTESNDSSWLANLLNNLSSRAADAHDKALASQNTLGIINNRSINAGLKRTVESNGDINTMVMMSPNVNESSGTAGAVLVVQQAKTFSFVQWYGSMVTAWSGTGRFYINVFKLNTTTGNFDWLFSSPDLSGTLSTTPGWNSYTLATPIVANPGDILGIELQVLNVSFSRTYQFAGWNVVTGAYSSATAQHQAFSQSRAGTVSTGIPAASIGWGVLQNSGTYSVPYVGLGVSTLPATVLPNLVLSATTPGSFTSMTDQDGNTYSTVPDGYFFADMAAIGGGGGGGGGAQGGGNNGNATTVIVGIHTKTSSGGSGGSGGAFGSSNISQSYGAAPSPQTATIGGATLFGGDQVGPQSDGSSPGGGAGGGHLGNDYGWGAGAAAWQTVTWSTVGGDVLSGTVGTGGTGRSGALSGSPGDGAPGAAYVVLRQS